MKTIIISALAAFPVLALAGDPDLCASEAKLIESTAVQRDKGVSFTDALDKVRTSGLPDQAKKQLMQNVALVYKFKDSTPDTLARNMFDACINKK